MRSGTKPFKDYLGSKYHFYQWIINQIPVHKNYFEVFVGNGAVFNHLKECELSVINDADGKVSKVWNSLGIYCSCLHFKDFLPVLNNYGSEAFVYLDPPYPHSTRKSKHRYNVEMSDKEHEELLTIADQLNCNIAISSYQNKMYDRLLKDWRRNEIEVMTRGGKAKESLYMNYDKPTQLHDNRYIGNNFTERQQIKRKLDRNYNKITGWELPEIHTLYNRLTDFLSNTKDPIVK